MAIQNPDGEERRRKVWPRFKFTGQQPGEEGVERDPEPKDKENREKRDDNEDENALKSIPIKEPSTEGKFSA
jgi:hypothetical protein